MLTSEHGLLARLDALVEVVADRHGLALAPGGRLAVGEARMAARAAGIAAPRGPTARGPVATQRDAVELLRAVGEGVGLLRVRGDRLEATSLRHAWAQIDPGLRAGLVYDAWCQQATLTGSHVQRPRRSSGRARSQPSRRPWQEGCPAGWGAANPPRACRGSAGTSRACPGQRRSAQRRPARPAPPARPGPRRWQSPPWTAGR